jgi:electron transport complex protein RnfD
MAKKEWKLHASFRPSRDYLFCLAALVIMAFYLYGVRPLILVGLSLATALLCDLLVSAARRVRFDITDTSSYLFAVIFTVMLPASARYDIVVIGTAVTILLGKHAFGGYGHYPFHPAAFGFAFASISWSEAIYLYPTPFGEMGLGNNSGAAVSAGIANTLKHGGVPILDPMDLAMGSYPGPLGTTFCFIMISFLVFLIVRGAMTWHIPVVYLATCALWAVLFRRIPSTAIQSVLYEMLSGAIIFSAVFIVAEPTTSPVNAKAKVIYGALLGIGTMWFRHVGVYEMGVCFAIILINPLAGYLDRMMARTVPTRRAKS